MAIHIPENILDDILARVDIVELISGYIPLKRAGRNFKAVCPFHHEKTPSFVVSPDRQIYHCFGCAAGGNAFNFLMQYERLEFQEAVAMLAKKVGVELPAANKQDSRAEGLITRLYKVNEFAALFYQNNFNAGAAEAKSYLAKRGIKPETAKLLKLGYAPDKWDGLTEYFKAKKIDLPLLEKAGLAIAKSSGGFYDRFRHKIIFPISDMKSRVIAFGARLIPESVNKPPAGDSAPKYVNSPETAIYVKGKNLYGLDLAKEAIRQADFVVVVEGYFDFIMPYQEGLQNLVASCGTALTTEQIRLIKRYTHNVVMVYDGDSAGQMATIRTLDMFIEEEMNVKVVSLPEGFDPDLFVRKHGIADFREKVEKADNIFDYKLKALKAVHNAKDTEGKAQICVAMLSSINKFKNEIIRSEYLRKLSGELNIKEEALFAEIAKIKEEKTYSEPAAGLQRDKALTINPTEKLLIKLMMEGDNFINRVKENLEPADFQDERISNVVSLIYELTDSGKPVEPRHLVNQLQDAGILQLVCESAFMAEASSDEEKERVAQDCIKRLKSRKLVREKEHLHKQIKTAQDSGNEEEVQRLIQEFHHLTKKR
ncbi:MAG: DNA primase [Candidatus Omnitrophica bacterium]|nr:DNA primase [Candidatus Omnitrophota bacterium]